MDRFQTVAPVEEQYKVQDLDSAIKYYRREFQFPQTLQKGSLRVFADQLEYPVPTDFDEFAFLNNKEKNWVRKPRPRFTSLAEFYEDPNYQNDAAEIWDGNDRFLALRYRLNRGSSQLISSAEDASLYTGSGDAGTPVIDNVFFDDGAGSIRYPVTLSSNTATFSFSFTSISDSLYKQKYAFYKVYFPTVPTSVVLRYGNDSSNYLSATVTTQFSGQSFKAGQWNILAFDLNTATTTGTITTTAFDYGAIIPTGVTTGNYYVDASYLKSWELLTFWYYSKFTVALTGSTPANQEYFINSSGVYATDSSFVGDSEWTEVIKYKALMFTLADRKDKELKADITADLERAERTLFRLYPSMRPSITTSKYNFETDFNRAYEIHE